MTRIEIPHSAFPLQWPTGVRRTDERESSKFHGHRYENYEVTNGQTGAKEQRSWKRKRVVTIAEARDEVRAELQRLGAYDPVVLSTNLRVRKSDGLPASNQADPADPGVAVYFVLDGRETCIAIDRFERVADNLRAVARTIDAFRGIERWGGASLVAAAFTGFQGLPGPGVIVPPVAWWDVLGVRRDAPNDAIEAAARRLVMEFHPDKGGDPAKYIATIEAWDAARREQRRA